MVCNHFQAWGFLVVRHACFTRSGFQQVDKQIDFVIAVYVLQDCGDALQAHACVHRRLRQQMHFAAFVAVELHEDVVPDFNETVAIFFRASWRASPDFWAVVIENLRARAARASVAHGPEVV